MSSRPARRIVVVGGGLGGGRTCSALRSAGFEGEIVLLGDERHLPYDRPPLTKAVLTQDADPGLGMDLAGLGIDVQLGVRATGLDTGRRIVRTDAGDEAYDIAVLATGARPLVLPGEGVQLTVRTLEDAHTLRDHLAPGSRVVLIGAGWIGAEVATAALSRGAAVTCLELGSTPVASVLGVEVGRRLQAWWDEVDLRLGVRVERVEDGGVRLGDGALVPADVVVTGIGVRPDLTWLQGCGLAVAGGGIAVDCDRRTSDERVFAVGDIAARWSDRLSAYVHAGHWDEAANGPAAVAAAVMGGPGAADEVPYFWSDQFGRKLQYLGQHRADDRVVIREHPEDPEKWGAAWLDERNRLTAHLSIGMPKAMVAARRVLHASGVVDPDRCRDLSDSLAQSPTQSSAESPTDSLADPQPLMPGAGTRWGVMVSDTERTPAAHPDAGHQEGP